MSAFAVGEFYATSRGAIAARVLRDRLAALWPASGLVGQSLLGYGYAAPYLRLWRDQAARCISLNPVQIGAMRWPAGAPNLSCTADEEALPFADLTFDRIVLVHGLETADHARRLLRELWRVLKDDGVLLVVAPNRRGMWAHLDSTPFGQGEPYSPNQICRVLAESLFRVERRDTALYLPPMEARVVLRSAHLWERTGRRLLPQFAGLTLSEAVKDVYAALPGEAVARRRLRLMAAT